MEHPDLRWLPLEIVPRDETVEGYGVGHDFRGIGVRCMRLNTRKVHRPGNHVPFLLLAIDDVTDGHEARNEAERQARLAHGIVDMVLKPRSGGRHDRRLGEPVVPGSVRYGGGRRGRAIALRPTTRPMEDRPPSGTARPGRAERRGVQRLQGRGRVSRHGPTDLTVERTKGPSPGQPRHTDAAGVRGRARALPVGAAPRPTGAAELAHRIKNSLRIITSSYPARSIGQPNRASRAIGRCRRGSARWPSSTMSYIVRDARTRRHRSVPGRRRRQPPIDPARCGGNVAVEAEPPSIATDQSVTVRLIVTELAINAIECAFSGERGRILLGFAHRDGKVVLTVADDGVGLAGTAGSSQSSGKGSRFVEAFVRQVGGTLATASGQAGTTFTVRLPAAILADT